MAVRDPRPRAFADRAAWRAWLSAQHAASAGLWLRVRRVRGAAGCITLRDAVDEALCFGWIDGTLRPIDADAYALWFSPRRDHSVWSAANKTRAARLIAEGKMAPAGLAAVEAARANGEWDAVEARRTGEPPAGLPVDLADAYRAWPVSRREQYAHWIADAKRPDTRARRLEKLAEALRGGGAPAGVSEADRLLDAIGAREARVRFGSAGELARLAERDPAAVYPRFDRIVGLLSSDSAVLRWNAIRIVGHLARVDVNHRIEPLLDAYLAPIAGPALVTAANTIKGATAIALAKPALADRIARAIAGAEHGQYPTDECRNVVIGHALDAFERLYEAVDDKAALRAFARRQRSNPRPATARRADRLCRTSNVRQVLTPDV